MSKITPRIWRFGSWGAGLQSTTLLVMSALGEIPPVDCWFFADTQWERAATYEIVRFYQGWAQEHDVTIQTVTKGNIRQLAAQEHIHIPFWTADGGHVGRQCTGHFKVEPIKRAMRSFAGFDPTKPPHPLPGQFELVLGISADEWTRAGDNDVKFVKNVFPLLELNLPRAWCLEYLQGKGLPLPPKSACIGCPYRTASEWLDMQQHAPAEWADAVTFDEENRANSLALRAAGVKSDSLYVWQKGQPLADVNWLEEIKKERQAKQVPLFNLSCGAFCHV